jgi:hypothetical protein
MSEQSGQFLGTISAIPPPLIAGITWPITHPSTLHSTKRQRAAKNTLRPTQETVTIATRVAVTMAENFLSSWPRAEEDFGIIAMAGSAAAGF